MSNTLPSKYIKNFFKMMNEENIEYRLIKNIAGELPDNLKDGKDIDIIVSLSDREKFAKCMDKNNFTLITHPLGSSEGWSFGYNLPEVNKWKLKGIKQRFYIDVCFMLMCKSISPKFWVPLDKYIQQRAWQEKEWNDVLGCWQIDQKTLTAYLLIRCIFDKQNFSDAYISEIEARKHLLDDSDVQAMLKTAFYKFTDTLIDMVYKGEYEHIVSKYITFTDY